MKLILFVIITLVPTLSTAAEKIPDCTGAGAWPASMAHAYLKNDGLLDRQNNQRLRH